MARTKQKAAVRTPRAPPCACFAVCSAAPVTVWVRAAAPHKLLMCAPRCVEHVQGSRRGSGLQSPLLRKSPMKRKPGTSPKGKHSSLTVPPRGPSARPASLCKRMACTRPSPTLLQSPRARSGGTAQARWRCGRSASTKRAPTCSSASCLSPAWSVQQSGDSSQQQQRTARA